MISDSSTERSTGIISSRLNLPGYEVNSTERQIDEPPILNSGTKNTIFDASNKIKHFSQQTFSQDTKKKSSTKDSIGRE